MTTEQAIKWLKYIKNSYSWSMNCDKSLELAIKSLDMWDKVIEEIEEEITTSEFEDYPTYDYRLGLERAIEIIEKYKKEIEE